MNEEGVSMSGSIDTIAIDVGTKSLNALWQRSSVISNNIANNDTPGYQEQTVSFEDQLTGALSDNTITESELANINAKTVTQSGSSSSDGSAVDMEQQMIELTRNQLQYSYLTRGLNDSLDNLKTAASDGRK
jgi:flagellar basal-body rod protein FlgB